jgi:putative aldouronate transport system substrate-binding protein
MVEADHRTNITTQERYVMKKGFVVLSILFLGLTLVFAAGSKDAKTDGKMNISWTAYQMAPTAKNAPMVKYYEDMFGVGLDVWNIDYQQYTELLNIRLAAGEIPDMFMVMNPADLSGYVEQGLLAPIPLEKIKKFMPNTYATYQRDFPNEFAMGQIDGQFYGLASISTGNMFRLPIIYNQTWLDALGLEVPTNIEEFERVIYAFAHGDPDGNGKKDTYGLSMDGLELLWGMYGMVPYQDYFSVKDGRIAFMPIEPEMKEALAYARKWYQDGVLDPEFITGENAGGYWAISHSFINGRVGMTVRGNYYHWLYPGDYNEYDDGKPIPNQVGAVSKELLAISPDTKIAFGQPLKKMDGTQGGIRGYHLLARFYGIGADVPEEKMDKILEILEHMGDSNPDRDAWATARHGIQGEDWRWLEKDHETILKLGQYMDRESYRYENGSVFWWTSGSELKSRQAEWGRLMEFDKNGIYSVFPLSLEAMNRYNAQLQTLREQAYIQIITGARPLDYFDTFVAEYLKIGGKEVIDAVQAWYAANN